MIATNIFTTSFFRAIKNGSIVALYGVFYDTFQYDILPKIDKKVHPD